MVVLCFVAASGIYSHWIVGRMWLKWGASDAGRDHVVRLAGIYVLRNSETEEGQKRVQRRLAMAIAVKNLIAVVCFAFLGGLSGVWPYGLASFLFFAAADGILARWRKLKSDQ